jgi:hypothetical protein
VSLAPSSTCEPQILEKVKKGGIIIEELFVVEVAEDEADIHNKRLPFSDQSKQQEIPTELNRDLLPITN